MLKMKKNINFCKMDGIGNDFIIFDARKQSISFNTDDIIAISSRENKITGGCDQLGIIEQSETADCFLRIYNADGSEVDACGNITRCVAWLLDRSGRDTITIRTNAGLLETSNAGDNRVSVNMEKPKFDWQDIPLSQEEDTLNVNLSVGNLSNPVCVNMGNPHAVFFVDDCDAIALCNLGSKIENHSLFPDRVNVGIAKIISPERIKLRVWERGAGETLACGTGACAAVIAACRRELTESKVTVELKGGELEIEWNQGGDVIMIGDVNFQFEGTLEI